MQSASGAKRQNLEGFRQIHVAGFEVKRPEGNAAILVEFAEKFDVLEPAGVNVRAKGVDAKVKQMAAYKQHNRYGFGNKPSRPHHANERVKYHADNARRKSHTKQTHITKQIAHPAGYAIEGAKAAEQALDGVFLVSPRHYKDDGRPRNGEPLADFRQGR